MTAAHVCMVHNNFDDTGSIARLAKWAAEVALGAGMRVTLVAHRVEPALAREVTVRPLYIPPRLHLVQWLAARRTIRRAMGDPGRYDLVHVHQPQVAALADIWQVHFLSRANERAGGIPPPRGPRTAVHWAQHKGVARAEDAYLRRLPPTVEVLFCSEWLRQEFIDLYGPPPRDGVLMNPGPAARPAVDASERAAHRRRLGVPDDGVLLGYLGGRDPRKGYEELIDRVGEVDDTHLLCAGAGADTIRDERLGERLHVRGRLTGDELDGFFRAIDALVVPSRFDPCPVVVNEAASYGVPILASPHVGSAAAVEAAGAGFVWDARSEPLAPALCRLADESAELSKGAPSFADAYSYDAQAARLLEHYAAAIERRARPAVR